jgi:hypothetical protein
MQSFTIRWQLPVVVLSLLALMSCSGNYGKKVTFPGHKGEVYYKGDSVTEADAKATGKFLEDQNFFLKDDKKRSVQILKAGGRVQVRFVVNDKALAETKNADDIFAAMGANLSKEVFNGKPVDMIYTDDTFKDKKIITYRPEILESEGIRLAKELKLLKKIDWNDNTLYYSSNIKENDINDLSKYFIDQNFFTTTSNSDIIVSQAEDGSVHLKFPIKNNFNTPEGMQKIEDFAKQLKADVFKNTSMDFEVLDENMKLVKTFTYY